jgi:hypothetical protein
VTVEDMAEALKRFPRYAVATRSPRLRTTGNAKGI